MNAITTNPNRIDLDEAYMQMAQIWAKRSKGNRLQVGALLVKDKQIISDGYNGMPAGDPDDVCEVWDNDPTDLPMGADITAAMKTKREVLHAESNALMKIARTGGTGADGATLYTVNSPCFECAKLIKQAGVVRVVFRHVYRDPDGIKFLQTRGVLVEQLQQIASAPAATKLPVQHPVAPVPMPVPPPIPAPVRPPVPAPNRSTSVLSAITGISAGNDVARLRAALPPPPPPAPEVEIEIEEVVIGQTDFTPVVSEDEVAALLRAHEAATKPKPAEAIKQPPVAQDGPYRSTFL
jgi:dCMP deaminase